MRKFIRFFITGPGVVLLVVGVAITVLPVLGHHGLDDHAHTGGELRVDVVGRGEGNILVDVLPHDLGGGVAAVGDTAGDHVVEIVTQ